MDGGCWLKKNVSFLFSVSLHSESVISKLFGSFSILISRWIDCLGNVHGRVDGRNASAEALIIGSHFVIFQLSSFCDLKLKDNYFIV